VIPDQPYNPETLVISDQAYIPETLVIPDQAYIPERITRLGNNNSPTIITLFQIKKYNKKFLKSINIA
jgi:hypothetical protein